MVITIMNKGNPSFPDADPVVKKGTRFRHEEREVLHKEINNPDNVSLCPTTACFALEQVRVLSLRFVALLEF